MGEELLRGRPPGLVQTRLTPEFYVSLVNALLLGILVLLPLGTLILRSLGEAGLTFEFYEKAFTNPRLRAVLVNTLIVAFGSTGIATFIGVFLAWMIHRTRMPLSSVLDVLIIVPFFVSPIVIALTWLTMAGGQGLINVLLQRIVGTGAPIVRIQSLWGIVLVMALYFVPYIYLYTSMGLKNIDPALEEASYTSGGGALRTALLVTLPLAMPAILAGVLLVFVLAASHFSVPLVLGTPNRIYVLTTIIFELMHFYPPDFNQAAAVSMVLLGITGLSVWAQRAVIQRRSFVTVTGRGRSADARRGGWLGIGALVFCGAYVLVFVLVPMFMLVLVSLMRFFTLTDPRFTFAHYPLVLLRHPLTLRGIRNSLILATVGATFTLLFTSVLGYVISRGRSRLRVVLDVLAMVPVMIPATAFAVALLLAWIRVPFVYGTVWILLLAYVTIYIPFGVRATNANLAQIHQDLEAASRTSGAGWAYTFRRIVVPLMRPGLTAAWVLLFVGMLKEISASVLLYTFGTETMSVVLYELWSEGSFPVAASMAVVQTLLVGVILVVFRRATKADLRALS